MGLNVEFKFITSEEFGPIIKKWRPVVFDESKDVILENLYTDEEKEKLYSLANNMQQDLRMYLIALVDGEIAGWSWGFQKSRAEFYMCNSAVLSQFRNQGIYTKMVEKVLEKACSLGFQEITSKHHACNNDVLIPKLKKGFMISGFEINARFGMMVNLLYLPNKKVEAIYQQRIGFKK